MEWYRKENGTIVHYDITTLRQLSKSVAYCNNVQSQELDDMVGLVFNGKVKGEDVYKVVASISNIVLVNRNLHMSHFIPQYATKAFQWCGSFASEGGFDVKSISFADSLAVFRFIFLTLYGGLAEVENVIIEKVFAVLLLSLKDCVDVLEQECKNEPFQLVLVEILKCLFTLHHKHHYGARLFENEEFTDDCLKIINQYSAEDITKVSRSSELLVIKHTFNLLLLLCEEREEAHTEESYKGPMSLYTTFFEHMKLQLANQLKLLHTATDEKKVEYYPLFLNSLVILQHMSTSLVDDIKKSPKDPKFHHLYSVLQSVVIPTEGSTSVYNQLLQILAMQAFPNLTSNHTFQHMQQLSFIKDRILMLFYNLTYVADTKAHNERFFELVGFMNANLFMEKNEFPIDQGLDLNHLAEPESKYLDKEAYLAQKPDFLKQNDTKPALDELTEEEKEQEAEKLFTLFERMEKLGTFENFQNPVKTWQQQGKFEEIE